MNVCKRLNQNTAFARFSTTFRLNPRFEKMSHKSIVSNKFPRIAIFSCYDFIILQVIFMTHFVWQHTQKPNQQLFILHSQK